MQSSTHRRSSVNHSKRTKTLQSVGCFCQGVNHEEKEIEATQSSAQKWHVRFGQGNSQRKESVFAENDLQVLRCKFCVPRRVWSKSTKFHVINNFIIL